MIIPIMWGRASETDCRGANYHPIAMGVYQPAAQSTESYVSNVPWRVNGTFSKLRIYVTTFVGTSSTWRTRRDGTTDGNITVTIDGSGVWESDEVNTDSVTSGQCWYLKQTDVSMTSLVLGSFQILFEPSSGNKYLMSGMISSTSGTSVTHYLSVMHGSTYATIEANTQTKFNTDGTSSNLFVRITTFKAGATIPFTLRINGADGSQTFDATDSGYWEDTDTTDDITDGDLLDIEYVLDATAGTLALKAYGMHFSADNANDWVCSNGNVGGNTLAQNTTNYFMPAGLQIEEPSEADANNKPAVAFTLSKLSAYYSAYSYTSGQLKVRINGGDGAGGAAITPSAGAWVTDAVNTESIAADDLFCFCHIIPNEASKACTFRNFSFVGTYVAAGGFVPYPLGEERGARGGLKVLSGGLA